MQTIAYISEARLCADDPSGALGKLLLQSHARNRAMGLTGVLLMRGNIFMHTLEGPKDAVRDVFASISRDSRHQHMYVLVNEPLSARRFPEWALEGFFDLRPGPDFQATLHRIGRHFCRRGQFNPTELSLFFWKMIAKMVEYRVSPTHLAPEQAPCATRRGPDTPHRRMRDAGPLISIKENTF